MDMENKETNQTDRLETYWKDLHHTGAEGHLTALQVVCNPALPRFANRVLDRIHHRALEKMLKKIPQEIKILDVGCGAGRWCERYRQHGVEPFGMDISFDALLQNKEAVFRGSAYELPVRDISFDAVSNITVLQHISRESQEKAVQEIGRIVKPGGMWVFMEHICSKIEWKEKVEWAGVFPRADDAWKKMICAQGFEIIESFRFQFLPFTQRIIDLCNRIEGVRRSLGKKPEAPASAVPTSSAKMVEVAPVKMSVRLRAYRFLKKILINAAMILDRIADRLVGGQTGSHTAILAGKK